MLTAEWNMYDWHRAMEVMSAYTFAEEEKKKVSICGLEYVYEWSLLHQPYRVPMAMMTRKEMYWLCRACARILFRDQIHLRNSASCDGVSPSNARKMHGDVRAQFPDLLLMESMLEFADQQEGIEANDRVESVCIYTSIFTAFVFACIHLLSRECVRCRRLKGNRAVAHSTQAQIENDNLNKITIYDGASMWRWSVRLPPSSSCAASVLCTQCIFIRMMFSSRMTTDF